MKDESMWSKEGRLSGIEVNREGGRKGGRGREGKRGGRREGREGKERERESKKNYMT